MIKRDELSNPASCLNKAGDDEPLFVLRAKDSEAPDAIADWINRRVAKGMNEHNDPKMKEAYRLRLAMIAWRRDNYGE